MTDTRIDRVSGAMQAYFTKAEAYFAAAEAAQADVTAQIAAAVAKDDADEDVDFAALEANIATAFAKVPEVPGPAPTV